ncbi:hypothetical protein EYF80_054734 [Liparis tanakae]|uniref:Uncharacterized protein n=1 Tax=Liparis tanakae TaxID=230148 RepID=A0A4Z2F2I6_9TELE|nr:hypothetical protein EYF80_054734 [Liparis tanakae]
MSLCFGGLGRTRHRRSRRSEKERLLVDEPRVFVNPGFRDSASSPSYHKGAVFQPRARRHQSAAESSR